MVIPVPIYASVWPRFVICDENSRTVHELLARCATGNSGNIAAAFFREFCQAQSFSELAEKAASGREKAWQAIATPCTGNDAERF